MLTISIVNHGHGQMSSSLCKQLLSFSHIKQIILTCNIPEPLNLPKSPKIRRIDNLVPKGFGANHNAAFQHCTQPFFCVLNPDIELSENPFPQLLATIEAQQASLVAPRIISLSGQPEDSIRHFPTISSLFRKLLHGNEGRHPESASDQQITLNPDWVAGMFMLFRSSDFAVIKGFDERYFLYYEDVDICARLHKANKIIVADLNATAIHHAQRASHKNLRHMRWHLTSMIRYLWLHR